MNNLKEALQFLSTFTKLHLYCADPGAYGIFKALTDILASKNIPFTIYCDGWAHKNSALPFTPMSDQALITFAKSDLFILGSQVDFARTYNLLLLANSMKLNTLFIFDHWKNYIEHFTNNLTKKLVLPHCVFFPDAECKNEFSKSLCNLTDSTVPKFFVTGHFAIDEMIQTIGALNTDDLKLVQSQLKLSQKETLLILLDPQSSDDNFGYQLETNIKAMLRDILASKREYNILIKPHPRQDCKELENILKMNWDPIAAPFLFLSANQPLEKLLAISDEVWGITTMGLIVAKKLGKKIRSYQIGRNAIGKAQSNSHIEDFAILD